MVVTIGALIQGLAYAIFLYNMATSWRRGTIADANPWKSRTLEWMGFSPPPLFNFHATPIAVGAPYDYGIEGAQHALIQGMPGYDEAFLKRITSVLAELLQTNTILIRTAQGFSVVLSA